MRSAATVALPMLARSSRGRADEVANRGLRLLACAILPLAALATAAGGPIVVLVFGGRYSGLGPVLALLLWAHFFGYTGPLLQQLLVELVMSEHEQDMDAVSVRTGSSVPEYADLARMAVDRQAVALQLLRHLALERRVEVVLPDLGERGPERFQPVLRII